MATAFIDTLSEAFENVDTLNCDKVRKLTEETATLWDLLQDQLCSGDPATTQEVKNAVLEIKRYIELQMSKLVAVSGSDYETLVDRAQQARCTNDAIAALQKLESEILSKT